MLNRMKFLNGKKLEYTLLGEIQFITIILSTAILVLVLIVSLLGLSYSMGNSLKMDAARVADELASHLSEPMYNVDDDQSIRVAESMMVSGRLSGIELVSSATGTLIAEMRGPGSRYVAPITRDIYQDGIFLGSVTLHFNDKDIIETKNRFITVGLTIMAAIFGVTVFVNRLILGRRTFRALGPILGGIDSIRAGDYGSRIEPSGYTDVNVLVDLINEMAAGILTKNSLLTEANALLEQRVAERTVELTRSLLELKQAQDRLVESGKLSALGLLAAGMAHELNTPLGAILSSNRNVIDYFDSKAFAVRELLASLDGSEFALFTRILELGEPMSKNLDHPEPDRARQQKIRADMEGLGLANPRAVAECLVDLGIDPDDTVLRSLLAQDRGLTILRAASDILMTRRMAEIVDIAGKKASAVVSALRSYLAPDSDDMETPVDIDGDIDKILTLMHNMLKHGVTVRREFSGARTRGSSDKLGQVWMNVIRNAAQAMNFAGELVIRTSMERGRAVVSFIDSGPGIPDEVLPRIFEPFFTTKKQGEGMGLGLDICRRVLEAHGGAIEVETRPGRTEFRISLPGI